MRKQYQKQAKRAGKYGAGAAKKTAAATEKAGAQAVGFIKRHPVGVLLALVCVLLLFMMQSCSSSLVMLGNSGAGAVGATTYPSKDEDILGAEAAYAGMEAELQSYLDTYESTHDYDEYHFDLDGIEHDPYVLISILSVLHEGEWTLSQVESTLEMLFDRQYILTERMVRETRHDSDGDPYSWYICYVTLENRNLSHLPWSLWARRKWPGIPCICPRLATGQTCSRSLNMWTNTQSRLLIMKYRENIWTMKLSRPFSPRRKISGLSLCVGRELPGHIL